MKRIRLMMEAAARWILDGELTRRDAAVEELGMAKHNLQVKVRMLEELVKDQTATMRARAEDLMNAHDQNSRLFVRLEETKKALDRPITATGKVQLESRLTAGEVDAALKGIGMRTPGGQALLAVIDCQWLSAVNRATADEATGRVIDKAHGEAEGLMVLKNTLLGAME